MHMQWGRPYSDAFGHRRLDVQPSDSVQSSQSALVASSGGSLTVPADRVTTSRITVFRTPPTDQHVHITQSFLGDAEQRLKTDQLVCLLIHERNTTVEYNSSNDRGNF